ncbi:hypothetical protein BegalDRAFT_0351 [Beggiatoa alba B18LD]|uniref:Glycosyltransferase n=1 Tax=Beggiatoa alba B18LD TaxID=395493 RepID=I3CCC8_9GAMM|nr:TIGR04282 family arsenosugar biosynthesis glycosyltransferase [Beggiatoa alba]EIJ41271.1 hypothetical protein BegalDRAFT_0351 [Beggiatoa alba B18LD]
MINRLQIFTKAPIVGHVKTRLFSSYSPEQATKIHQGLIHRCLAQFTPHFNSELWCSPNCQHPFFQHCQQQYPISLYTQQGDDLGMRMLFALQQHLPVPTVLIGTDCPSLSVADIQQAFQVLQQGCPVVLAPAEDGGYVLVGIQGKALDIFSTMPWSQENLIHETRARLRQLRCDWYELPLQWDIDRPEDVQRYFANPSIDNARITFNTML